MYHLLGDRELLTLAQEGETNAFQELYTRYWERLFVHAMAMTSSEDTAKDIVQEIFVELWDKRQELQIKSSLKAYLYRTVKNKVFNIYARNQVHEKYLISLTEFEKQENNADHLLRENLVQSALEKEIAALPHKMRRIFEMSRSEHMSYKEIAEELQISDKTVKKQISNALKILRSKLAFLLHSLLLAAFLLFF